MNKIQEVMENGVEEFENDIKEYVIESKKTPSRLNETISPMIIRTIEMYRERFKSHQKAIAEAVLEVVTERTVRIGGRGWVDAHDLETIINKAIKN